MSNQKSSVVRKICRAYIDGHSMRQIAEALNAEHVPCFGGGIRWTQGQIAPQLRSALADTVLTGDEFAALQATLSHNKGRRGGRRANDWISNLFPNRVRCAACGASVSTHNTEGAQGKPQRCYRCSKRCQEWARMPIDRIENDFFQSFLPMLAETKDVLAILSVLGDNIESALSNPEIRARLVSLLPSVVHAITIDWRKHSYRVITVGGREWPMQHVEKYVASPPDESEGRWAKATRQWEEAEKKRKEVHAKHSSVFGIHRKK